MYNSIKPVGTPLNSWADWESPAGLRREGIPASPGVYQLGAFTAVSIYTPAADRPGTQNDTSDILNRIVYIGKADCLQERFWLLVQSWQPNTSIAPHCSRKSYNGSHNCVQTLFNPADVRVRYKLIGSVDWPKFREYLKKSRAPGASLMEAVNGLWADHGWRAKSRSDQNEYLTVNATFVEERSLLRKFKTAWGVLPLLNKRGPESMGDTADDTFIRQWLIDEEAAMDSVPCADGVRFRAFKKWRERGSPLGDEWRDWFDAETELWERVVLNW